MRRVYTVIITSLGYAILYGAVGYGDVEPPNVAAVPVADFPAGPTVDQPSDLVKQGDVSSATKLTPGVAEANLGVPATEQGQVEVPAKNVALPVTVDKTVIASPAANEKVDLPSATEELSDLETPSPPVDLPLTKKALDAPPKAADPLPLKPAQKSTQQPNVGELFLSPLEQASPGARDKGGLRSPLDVVVGSGQSDPTVTGSQDTVPSLVSPHGDEPMYNDTHELLPMYDDATPLGGVAQPVDCGAFGGGWDFGGWLSGGFTANAHGNRTSTGNAPMGFNNYADGLLLNQAWTFLEKETQSCGCGFDWGFRIDFLFGADAPDTQAFGDGSWDASWDTGGEYGFAMPQLYGEIAYKRTKTRFGRFFSIIGYEIVPAPHNFFYSHSYARYYIEPFTHTGFLTQYDVKPNLSLFGGWTAGWDSGFENRNDGSSFLGGAIWNVSDRLDIMYATSAGDPGDVRIRSSEGYVHSLIGDIKFGYGWNYVFQWDYRTQKSGRGPRTDAYAINQYLFKQLRDNISVGTRLEYFRDKNGESIGNGPGDYYQLTFGVNWRPLSRMVVRPEIRWDWFEGAGLPFDDNTRQNQFTFGMDAVYVF